MKKIKDYNNFANIKFNVENNTFKLYFKSELVSESKFQINKPDYFFDKKYIGLFRLKTLTKFRNKGFGEILINNIFDYVKNNLKLNHIFLNVYTNNTPALNLYFKTGFSIFGKYDDDDESYYTLVKIL
jgi:ribosomal protein S18 acetylase RimI-like enzyme